MKILEVLDCYFPKFDGPNHVVTHYSNCLIENKNADVEVLVPYFPNYKDNQKFNVLRAKSIKGPEGYRVGLAGLDRKIKKHLKEKKYDIIHFHSPFTMGRFVAKFGKKYNIPTIFTFHTKYKEDINRNTKSKPARKIAMNYIMKTINLADHVLTVSNGAADCLREYGYTKQIDVIRNGTDLVCPANVEELKERVNKEFSLDKDEKVLLSVGRIVDNKKLDLALEAAKVVLDKGYKFKFLIVGAGPYEEILKKHASDLGLDNVVIFTGKIMDRELLSAVYLRSDLFMFPSTFDTASLAPIEAASMGVPTLMTLGCSTAEIIRDEQNGLLAEADKELWAEKIISILTDNKKLLKLKENCKKEVYRSWASVVDEVYEYYNSVLKGE